MPKRKYQRPYQLLTLATVAALTLIAVGGCVYTPYEGDVNALEEQQSVWQYLKVYSIFQDLVPAPPLGSMTPCDMFDRIHDTLFGVCYTKYMDGNSSDVSTHNSITGLHYERALTDGYYRFHDAQPLTADSSTMYFHIPDFLDAPEFTIIDHFELNIDALRRRPNLIIDVRGNGGGLLSMVDSILGELLPYDTPYIKNRYRRYNGRDYVGEMVEDNTSRTTTRSPRVLNQDGSPKRIAVLMDGKSASASEILAAGLKDGAGAFLVGGKSCGKGIGQVIIKREKREQISITFMEIWGLTERTGRYHRIGIIPDPVPQEAIDEALARWPHDGSRYVRELYHALKMLEPGVTLNPDDGGDALAERLNDVTATVYGDAAAAKTVWRPMGAVIVNEKDLPGLRSSGEYGVHP